MCTCVQLSLWVSSSSSFPLYLGNLIMSPTWQISLVVLFAKLKAALGHLYVVLTVQRFIPTSDYYPDSIIILSKHYLCLPSFIQFLVILVIHWRIYFLPHHGMVSHRHFLKMKTYSFDDGTLGFTIIIGELLFFSCQFHLLIDNLLSPFHVRLQHFYSHGMDCTGSFGFRWRT